MLDKQMSLHLLANDVQLVVLLNSGHSRSSSDRRFAPEPVRAAVAARFGLRRIDAESPLTVTRPRNRVQCAKRLSLAWNGAE